MTGDSWGIPADFVRVPCDLCGSPPGEPFVAKHGGFYTRCESCSFVYANPRHARPWEYNATHNEELREDYVEKQYAQRHQRKYAAILRSFQPYRRTNRLLEIGCSTGGFCYRARQMGWEPTGIEPVPAVAEYGRRKHGLDIRCYMFEQADLPSNTFDVVFSNAVLEHISSPTAFLSEAFRVLRPGGVMYADTVNIRSLTWRWIGPEWKLVDPRAHLSLFSPNTLRGFYLKSGFRVLALTTHGVRIRPNHAKRLAGLARWTEEALKLPFRVAAWWTLQGDSVSAIGQKAA